MIQEIQIKNVKCVAAPNAASSRVVYMIYPAVEGFSNNWLQQQAAGCHCSIVMVYVSTDDWDNLLTPWPASGVPKGYPPFKGEAEKFNNLLITEILPQAEKAMELKAIAERDLIGVSLGGLFTLWQWMQFDTFRSIGCLSGSFWYEGFIEWFLRQGVPAKEGLAYFLLGTEEPKAKVKAFQSVGTNTETIVDTLRSKGLDIEFEWVPGNHFASPLHRADKAFAALTDAPTPPAS